MIQRRTARLGDTAFDYAFNAISGRPSSSQLDQVASDTYTSVRRAGGSDADAASAAAQARAYGAAQPGAFDVTEIPARFADLWRRGVLATEWTFAGMGIGTLLLVGGGLVLAYKGVKWALTD